MKKILLSGVICLVSLTVYAKCLLGDAYVAKKRMDLAREAYLSCARTGDLNAYFELGKVYRDGVGGPKDVLRALFYFRFAAENGMAEAQRELAKTMFQLRRQGKDGIAVVNDYEKQMGVLKSRTGQSDTPIYAYTWLLLAAEKADNKWFYPAGAKQDLEAVRLYNSMKGQLTKDEQQQVLAQASAFKEEKLNRTAQTVLSESEYNRFKNALYPQNGPVNSAARSMEMARLKEKIKQYTTVQPTVGQPQTPVKQTQEPVEFVEPVKVPGRLGF